MGLFSLYISLPYSGAIPTHLICCALKLPRRTRLFQIDIFCVSIVSTQRPVPVSPNQGPSKRVIPKPLLRARIRQVTPRFPRLSPAPALRAPESRKQLLPSIYCFSLGLSKYQGWGGGYAQNITMLHITQGQGGLPRPPKRLRNIWTAPISTLSFHKMKNETSSRIINIASKAASSFSLCFYDWNQAETVALLYFMAHTGYGTGK